MRRREFTTYLSTGLLSAMLPISSFASEKNRISDSQWFASASEDQLGGHWLVVFNRLAEEKLSFPLPSRAHQVLKHPHKPWIFVIGRRPGHYLYAIDMQTGERVADYQPAKGQHFCGHMQISADGETLYTTENITRDSSGLVVLRNIDEEGAITAVCASGGLGPHQLLLSYDEQYIVVANGGIHTRNREKMNLDSMAPNLSYIKLVDLEIEQKITLDKQLAQLSIRHIAINRQNAVVIAMQYQGERTVQVPLVALHKPGEAKCSWLDIPDVEYFTLKHYCGSACFDSSGDTVAVSAPRGDKVLFWSISEKAYLGSTRIRDGCGIAISTKAQEFIISSGRGRVYKYNLVSANKQLLVNNPTQQWDNHLAAI